MTKNSHGRNGVMVSIAFADSRAPKHQAININDVESLLFVLQQFHDNITNILRIKKIFEIYSFIAMCFRASYWWYVNIIWGNSLVRQYLWHHMASLDTSDLNFNLFKVTSGSTLAQVMACCLAVWSDYLNQCWLILCKVGWHSSDDNFTRYLDHQSIKLAWNYLS